MKNFKFALGSLLLVAMLTIGSAFSLSPNTHGPAPAPTVTLCDWFDWIGADFRNGDVPATPLGVETNWDGPKAVPATNPCSGSTHICAVKVCRESPGVALTKAQVIAEVKAKYIALGNIFTPLTGTPPVYTFTVVISNVTYTFTVYFKNIE